MQSRDRPDISAFLQLFSHKVRESTKLSRHEVQAVSAFLAARVKEFHPFSNTTSVLRQLIRHATILDLDMEDNDAVSQYSVDLQTALSTVRLLLAAFDCFGCV